MDLVVHTDVSGYPSLIKPGAFIQVFYPVYVNGEEATIAVRITSVAESEIKVQKIFGDSPFFNPPEQKTSISLQEQLAKLDFKEQNKLYKLLNAWGCRMER